MYNFPTPPAAIIVAWPAAATAGPKTTVPRKLLDRSDSHSSSAAAVAAAPVNAAQACQAAATFFAQAS